MEAAFPEMRVAVVVAVGMTHPPCVSETRKDRAALRRTGRQAPTIRVPGLAPRAVLEIIIPSVSNPGKHQTRGVAARICANRPVPARIAHGTRTDTCIFGSCRAPLIIVPSLPLWVRPSRQVLRGQIVIREQTRVWATQVGQDSSSPISEAFARP